MIKKNNCSCGKEKYEWDKRCWSCQQEDDLKVAKQEAIAEGHTRCEKWILCPHCGEEYPCDEIHNSDDLTCCDCGKVFYVEVNYTVDYSTSKKEE